MKPAKAFCLGLCVVLVLTLQTALGLVIQPADWPADPVAGPRLQVQSFKLNDYQAKLDGQWQGNKIASDGNVYFFGSTHSGDAGAWFFKYNPNSGTLTPLFQDLGVALGGARTETGRIAAEFSQDAREKGEATIIG